MRAIYFLFVFLSVSFDGAVCRKTKNPLILISLDGLRADRLDKFINENPDSYFASIAKSGVKAEFMKPVFPTATFVNHWAIVTGLFPETNGIVANTFFSETYNKSVPLQGAEGLNIQWWNASKPIWLTAKDQGLKTATSFWPGSETVPYVADIFLKFNASADQPSRAIQAAEWIKKNDTDFVALYLDQPDAEGHIFGAESTQYMNMLKTMDGVIGGVINRLKDDNMYNETNIMIVSDHGFGTIKNISDYILLKEHFDTSIIDARKTIYSKISQVYPISENLTDDLVSKINNISHLKAYKREDVPARLNYNKNSNIGRIVVMADEGYTLAKDRKSYEVGHHGYDTELPNMRAIFLARGPAFKENTKISSFQNINLYPVMCKLLEIKGQQSNSTIDLSKSVLKNTNKRYLGNRMLVVFFSLISLFIF